MEFTQVKGISLGVLHLLAQLEDAQVADIVGGGLTGDADVAAHFALYGLKRATGILDHEVHCLVEAPALDVQAGIHHQASSAEGFHLQTTQVAGGIYAVEAKLPGQALGV